jgi:predicted metal-dependent HD superfamily phosphohydrolase
MQDLADRFRNLWLRCSGADATANAAWQQLEALYTEPHRHYHTLAHIADSLGHLDAVAPQLADDADAVELAIWFHDAVYSVAQFEYPYNEARSAAFFATLARGELADRLVAKVEELILATTHKALHEDRACRYLVDIDLAGIGAPWSEFLANSAAIQREQNSTPEQEVEFLEVLNAREHIYQTSYFSTRLEASARENIGRYREVCAAKAERMRSRT